MTLEEMKEKARELNPSLPYDLIPVRVSKNNKAKSKEDQKQITLCKVLYYNIYSHIYFIAVTFKDSSGEIVRPTPCLTQGVNLQNIQINNKYWQVRRHNTESYYYTYRV